MICGLLSSFWRRTPNRKTHEYTYIIEKSRKNVTIGTFISVLRVFIMRMSSCLWLQVSRETASTARSRVYGGVAEWPKTRSSSVISLLGSFPLKQHVQRCYWTRHQRTSFSCRRKSQGRKTIPSMAMDADASAAQSSQLPRHIASLHNRNILAARMTYDPGHALRLKYKTREQEPLQVFKKRVKTATDLISALAIAAMGP